MEEVLEVATYSTVAMTLGLVVARPRVGIGRARLSPAAAAALGVVLLMLLGVVGPQTIGRAVSDLWRSFVAIGSIMVMTEVALRVGLLDWAARRVEAGARSTARLFGRVFLLGVVTATVLNNDAAILLLTPLVVELVRRRHPDRPELVLPFAFAVFMAAGVAPLLVSNPMNMVVAGYMGIGFNAYALTMAPVAAAGWLVAYVILRAIFGRALAAAPAPAEVPAPPRPATGLQRLVLVLLLGVLAAYSVVGYLGGPVWAVAAGGALVALAIGRGRPGDGLARLVREGVSWETLAFLLAVVVLAFGLREVGLVDRLGEHYAAGGTWRIGATSALGSAVLNNHPMAYMNMLAIESSAGDAGVFAALIGGDLGPRLLPIGSLAGLLWIELLRRRRVDVPLRQFVGVGLLVTAPAFVASVLVLELLT
jgi:arsenical pump membrane protein